MPANNANAFLKNYEIAPPKEYKTAAAGEAPGIGVVGQVAEILGVAPVTILKEKKLATENKQLQRPKHAIWIVHGMGQQIPFETLDSLATGLRSVDGGVPKVPRLRAVKFGDQVVQRVELDVTGKSGKLYELHLYEAYWAPLTEGVSKLSDVISFFFDGGSRGLLNAVKKFQRAMFGGMAQFTIHKRTIFEIGATLAILLSLMAINTVIVAAGAAKTHIPIISGLQIGDHWPQLTALASTMCSVALTFGVILFMAEMCKPACMSKWKKILICDATWVGLAITGATIVLSAVLMMATIKISRAAWLLDTIQVKPVQGVSTGLILAAGSLVGIAMFWRAVLRSLGEPLRGNGFLVFLFILSFLLHLTAIVAPCVVSAGVISLPAPISDAADWLSNPLWVWPFLITLSANVRTLMVQYAGDVAVYVSGNKLDRFGKVRKQIKKIAQDSLKMIYQAPNDDGDGFEYEKIAVVGHSLGSVIAYDTLNKMLTDDSLSQNELQVADRTCLLETFGSPLDKIAFFFTIQGKDSFHIREQLADLVQPLIQSYPKFRKFPWINVYSRNDIVSGDLFLFDSPPPPAPPAGKTTDGPEAAGPSSAWVDAEENRVINLADPEAIVPLVAHVDYWKNPLVWTCLFDVVAP
jgi:hypothetical protein